MKTEFAQNQLIMLFIICIVTGNAQQQQHELPSFKLWVKTEGASGDGVGDGQTWWLSLRPKGHNHVGLETSVAPFGWCVEKEGNFAFAF